MKRMIPISALAVLLMLFFLWGCEHDTTNEIVGDGGGGGQTTDMSCLGCHSSQDMLEEALGEEGAKVEVAIKSDG